MCIQIKKMSVCLASFCMCATRPKTNHLRATPHIQYKIHRILIIPYKHFFFSVYDGFPLRRHEAQSSALLWRILCIVDWVSR